MSEMVPPPHAPSPLAAARSASSARRPLLKATRLGKHFVMGPDKLHVLTGCSLVVGAGEFVAIMGKSGSGKSTLLHILGALDVPQQGEVVFDGQPVFAPEGQRRLRTGVLDFASPAERQRNHLRRTQFGFVFQFYHLLPELNVLENVLIARMVACPTLGWLARRGPARREAASILDRVGLAQRLRHRPNELSGGERQRVALARALVHQPQLLLADEPTGNLDGESGQRILDLLSELHREGQTIIMVTHDRAVAQRADRILVLKDGALHDA